MSELYHYGVKGMKWGVRKRRTNNSPIKDATWVARRSSDWNPKNYGNSSKEKNRDIARASFHRDRAYDVQDNRRRLNSKIKLALTPKRTLAVGKHYLLSKLYRAKVNKGFDQDISKINARNRKRRAIGGF